MKKVLAAFFAVIILLVFSANLFADDFYIERIQISESTTLVIIWSEDRSHVIHEYLEID
jgi:hypothetical protein